MVPQFPFQPTGRAIQVEIGSGERLPSVDTRPPRIRDSDAVIEVIIFPVPSTLYIFKCVVFTIVG